MMSLYMVIWLTAVSAVCCSPTQSPSTDVFSAYKCVSECVLCQKNVTKKLIPDKPQDCEIDSRVKNANCYQYKHHLCKSREDMQAISQEVGSIDVPGGAPIKVTCCMVAQMLNYDRPDKTQYKCYSEEVYVKFKRAVNEPLLDCPLGKMGNGCQDNYTEPVGCKCFPDELPFSGPKNFSKCDDENRISTRPECLSSACRNGEKYECICSNSKDLGNIDTTCSVTNGTQKRHPYKSFISLCLCMILLVSKT